MEKPNTKMKLIISLSILAVLVLTALTSVAYSFFVAEFDVDEALNVNTNISEEGKPIFNSKIDGNLNIEITTADLLNSTIGEVVESSTQTLTVDFIGGSENAPMSCSYDIVWTESDNVENQYIPSTGVNENNLNEYTLKITKDNGSTILNETQISKLNSGSAVASGITVSSNGTKTTQKFFVTTSIYRLDIDQSIWGKNYLSTISVENVECRLGEVNEVDSNMTIAAGDKLVDVVVNLGSNNTMAADGSWGVINENGYRYEGADPENYICFGSDAETCPDENLYRIVGAFDIEGTYLAKIWKYTNITSDGYYFYGDGSSFTSNKIFGFYPYSTLFNEFNTTYYNTIASYTNYINGVTWYLGALPDLEAVSASTADIYAAERGSVTVAADTVMSFNIGLIYPSDYGYAVLASDCSRDITMRTYNLQTSCIEKNWLYDSMGQWTITAVNTSFAVNARIMQEGYISSVDVSSSKANAHPTFYLNPELRIVSGTGTLGDPYRISL